MDGPKLVGVVGKGYARAGNKIGTAHQWYRGGLITPIQAPNLQGTLQATFAPDRAFKTIPKFNTMLFFGFVNTAQAQPGDILVGSRTYVLLQTGLIPPTALVCPNTLSVQRVAQASSPTEGSYQTVTQIAQSFPGNIQLKRDKGYAAPVGFPGATNTSAPMPEWTIYLPWLMDGAILDGDMITDENSNTYKVDAMQFTPWGYVLGATPYEPNA